MPMYSVCLPWVPNNPASEGTYTVTVEAENEDEALRSVATEMAAIRKEERGDADDQADEADETDDEDDNEYIESLAFGWSEVWDLDERIVNDIQNRFRDELIIDGKACSLNIEKLRDLIVQNRDILIIK